MKIKYIANVRIPTEKAHGIYMVKILEAFAEEGVDTELIIPETGENGDIFSFYDVKRNFNIKRIYCFNSFLKVRNKKIFYILRGFLFSFFSSFYIYRKYWKERNQIIFFSHDNIVLFWFSFLLKNIYYDIHDFPGLNFINKRVLKRALGVAVQTRWKINALADRFKIDKNKIVYWPNGTDFKKFSLDISKSSARQKLNLPLDINIVLYSGQLFTWKGVETLVRSIDGLDDNTFIYILGGVEEDLSRIKRNVVQASDKRVVFVPFQPHDIMPTWMRAADVLVIPNTAKEDISLYYTSPMKMFEYMLIGRPIVASAIPSIQEILNDENSFLAEADNPKSFSEKINIALNDKNLIDKLVINARNDVKNYTWENRAKKILTSLRDKIN